jgi:hypothetical protein
MNIYKNFSLLSFIFLCVVAIQLEANDQIVFQEKVGTGLFTPETPPIVSYRDSNLILEPVYNANHISVLIKNLQDTKRTKKISEYQVSLPDTMEQLNELKPVYGNKVVAIGLANSTVPVISIIDRNNGLVIDTFYGYKPTISPNGRLIAFQEFFPPHGDENIKSCYRVYDVSHSAAQNRNSQTDVYDPQLVGTSVYPLIIRNQQIECGIASENGEFMMASNTFIWSDESDQFLFAVNEVSTLNIVLVKLNKNNKKWQTFTYNLNKDKNICSATCESPRVTSLELKDRAIIAQVFNGQLGEKPITFSIPIDELVLTK